MDQSKSGNLNRLGTQPGISSTGGFAVPVGAGCVALTKPGRMRFRESRLRPGTIRVPLLELNPLARLRGRQCDGDGPVEDYKKQRVGDFPTLWVAVRGL